MPCRSISATRSSCMSNNRCFIVAQTSAVKYCSELPSVSGKLKCSSRAINTRRLYNAARPPIDCDILGRREQDFPCRRVDFDSCGTGFRSQCRQRQAPVRQGRLLPVPWLSRPGWSGWRQARPATDRSGRSHRLRPSSHRPDAALHQQGSLRRRPRGHPRVFKLDSRAASGQRHPALEPVDLLQSR